MRARRGVSLYGTSVVRRLSKAQATELDNHLLAIAHEEKPTSVRGMYCMDGWHMDQAERHRRTLEALISHHETKAEKLLEPDDDLPPARARASA